VSVRTGWALLKAEMSKVWGRPILEITFALMAIMSVSSIMPFTKIDVQSAFSGVFRSMVAESVSATVVSLLLPLILMCAILMSLSFARDYEQGLMQSLLSLPISRRLLFAAKFFAVVLPLTLLSWFFVTLFVGITFYSNFWLVLQFSFFALLVSFLFLMFCGGIGALVALVIKRTIPSVLAVMLTNLLFWFIAAMESGYAYSSIGEFARYMCLTPYKSTLIFLDKLLGITPNVSHLIVKPLEGSLSVDSFGILAVFYACILVVPVFVYFCRRFEICE